MAATSANSSNTLELGKLLYSQYLYPLEIAAVILLVMKQSWPYYERQAVTS